MAYAMSQCLSPMHISFPIKLLVSASKKGSSYLNRFLVLLLLYTGATQTCWAMLSARAEIHTLKETLKKRSGGEG